MEVFSVFLVLVFSYIFRFFSFCKVENRKKRGTKCLFLLCFFFFFTKRKVLKQVLKKRAGKSSYRVLNVSFCSFSSFWCFFFCKKRSTKKMKKKESKKKKKTPRKKEEFLVITSVFICKNTCNHQLERGIRNQKLDTVLNVSSVFATVFFV